VLSLVVGHCFREDFTTFRVFSDIGPYDAVDIELDCFDARAITLSSLIVSHLIIPAVLADYFVPLSFTVGTDVSFSLLCHGRRISTTLEVNLSPDSVERLRCSSKSALNISFVKTLASS